MKDCPPFPTKSTSMLKNKLKTSKQTKNNTRTLDQRDSNQISFLTFLPCRRTDSNISPSRGAKLS